jgi:hypothetical protein
MLRKGMILSGFAIVALAVEHMLHSCPFTEDKAEISSKIKLGENTGNILTDVLLLVPVGLTAWYRTKQWVREPRGLVQYRRKVLLSLESKMTVY